MADTTITPEIEAVLRRAVIQGMALKIVERLAPNDYKKVNSVLERCGGQWSRKLQAHIFSRCPKAEIDAVINSGISVDVKKQRQAFYTPDELATDMAEIACLRGHEVLEPSAGDGAIADACMRSGAQSVHCVEIDPAECDKLKAKGYRRVQCADFLKIHCGPGFTRIVMNPPFTKGKDVKHVRHAVLHHLAIGGRLVAIMSPTGAAKILNECLAPETGVVTGWKEKDIPAGAFKSSGTNVATVMVIFQRNN